MNSAGWRREEDLSDHTSVGLSMNILGNKQIWKQKHTNSTFDLDKNGKIIYKNGIYIDRMKHKLNQKI